jgi:hypothetical protein
LKFEDSSLKPGAHRCRGRYRHRDRIPASLDPNSDSGPEERLERSLAPPLSGAVSLKLETENLELPKRETRRTVEVRRASLHEATRQACLPSAVEDCGRLVAPSQSGGAEGPIPACCQSVMGVSTASRKACMMPTPLGPQILPAPGPPGTPSNPRGGHFRTPCRFSPKAAPTVPRSHPRSARGNTFRTSTCSICPRVTPI